MKVRQLVPYEAEVTVPEILSKAHCDPRVPPFAPARMRLCQGFSERLFADAEARQFPDLQALAYFMRQSQLQQMEQQFRSMQSEDRLIAPRGIAFHLAPANVDTIFAYSWLFSALTGNTSIVRVSTNQSQPMRVICRVLNECLASEEKISDSASTQIVTYEHDEKITYALSQVADVRVIWGGDETVSAIRQIPLKPHAKEIVFPDRHSMAALSIDAVMKLSDEQLKDLAHRFYIDTFWFDQMACSSPRVLIWCGPKEKLDDAQEKFWTAVRGEIADRKYHLDTSAALAKLTATYQAVLDQPVANCERYGNELTLMQLDGAPKLESHPCFGTVYQSHLEQLSTLAARIEHRDQTLAHFGFEKSELMELARNINGRGLDRIVPFGEALTFGRYWDGYDLLYEMVRFVQVEAQ